MRRGRISVLQLDSFWEPKKDLEEANETKYLVRGGALDHLPIFLQIEKDDKKPHGPFKFKQSLLGEVSDLYLCLFRTPANFIPIKVNLLCCSFHKI